MFRNAAIVLLSLAVCVPTAAGQAGGPRLETDAFRVVAGSTGLVEIGHPGDPYETRWLKPGRPLGETVVHYRTRGETSWRELLTRNAEPARRPYLDAHGEGWEWTWEAPGIELVQVVRLAGDLLQLELRVRNVSNEPVEIGNLGLAVDLNDRGSEDMVQLYEQRLVRHQLVSGHGSFLFWQRPNGDGPILVMTPQPGTWLEYHDLTDHFREVSEYPWVYVHAGLQGATESRGSWRQAHTVVTLAPAGEPGAATEHGFDFAWADDREGVRDRLVEAGLVDVRVVPGMVVPTDLEARFALRTRRDVEVEPEFPHDTEIRYLGESEPGLHLYSARFLRLGENGLILRWSDDTGADAGDAALREVEPFDPAAARSLQDANASRGMVPDPIGAAWAMANPDPPAGRTAVSAADGPYMLLEFFVTEPLEVLVHKRAAHLVNHQQHRDPDVWYDGLFSAWDMREGGTLRGPDDTDGFDGWWGYVLAADDPALGKAPFLAAKNALWPDPDEIAALEYHVDNFVWGGLQRTDEERPYPYGVYGVPNWFVNRTSPFGWGSGGKGVEHIWRMYDYPHVAMLWLNLARIARRTPEHLQHADPDLYLERAFRTAVAGFEYPYELLPWYEVYMWGTMNELVYLELVAELERAGRPAEADALRVHLDRKIKYFVYDDPYPYRSEYAFDDTGFESTQAFARFALEQHPLQAGENAWRGRNDDVLYSHEQVSPADVRAFLDRQIRVNASLRGEIEPAYYQLGSTMRGSPERYLLKYMTAMGGQAILEYGLEFAPAIERHRWLRLGYPSILAGWSLLNSAPDGESGYWFGGAANDGAAGWGFDSEKFGPQWIRKESARGPWYYDGEVDLTYGAFLRAAATVVYDDPVFGLTALGGEVREVEGGIEVIPRDGVRRRLWVLRDGWQTTHLELLHARFAADEPIFVSSTAEVRYRTEDALAPEPDPRLLEAVRWYLGQTGTVDDARARELLLEALEDGGPLDRMWLARAHSRGRMFFERDEARADEIAAEVLPEVERLAELGVAEAAFLMGTAYAEGLAVAPDPGRAVAWYLRAADQGHVLAAHNLGNAYEAGEGVVQSAAHAVLWWRRAAEAGDAIPQWQMGRAYEEGLGVEADLETAVEWYRRAAARGNGSAREALERLLDDGDAGR